MNKFALTPQNFLISSPPGDTLQETLGVLGMSQAELALRTGRPLKTINEIIKVKAAITPETALQFERVLGISATFWMNREQQYRESQARQVERQDLQQYTDWLGKFPLKEMAQYQWLEHLDDPIDQVNALLRYFSLATPDNWLIYWTSTIPNIQDNRSFQRAPGSTTAWLRKGELEAQVLKFKPYQASKLRHLLVHFCDFIDKPAEEFYADLVQMFSQAGVAFCVVQDLPGQTIRFLTRWLSPTKVLLQLSASLIQPQDFWYSVFHGLGHILLHGKRKIFMEEDVPIQDEREGEADRFAQEFLPANNWSGSEPALSWDVLQPVRRGLEDEWPDLLEESANLEPTLPEPSKYEDSLALAGWPGLTAGARRALLAAGMAEEAGRVDEQLFSDWVGNQIANIESAFEQGFYRDALMDLENLVSVVNLGAMRSPALGAMLESLRLLKQAIQTRPEQELLLLARQAIIQTNRPTHAVMVAEARKMYSVAATRTESGLAEELFKNQ